MINLGFILAVIAGLFILVLLVVIHELGHAIVARRNGVTVEEFGVGFLPQAKSWVVKKSFLGDNVRYSLNWLPIGGFVKLKGEYDAANKKGDYGAASFAAKTKIIFAGVAMNWLTAVALFTILAIMGMPKLLANQFHLATDVVETNHPLVVESVKAGSPAQKAGIIAGDIITRIDGDTSAADITKAPQVTKQRAGKTIMVDYIRDEVEVSTPVTLNTSDQAKNVGYLGVVFKQNQTTLRSTWSAPIVGVGLTGQLSWETLKGLGGLVGKLGSGLVGMMNFNAAERSKASAQLGDAGNSVAGPVGIVFNLLPGAVSAGLTPLLLITAVLSLTLAVMNVLPIPALDGGRWYLMAFYKAMGRPLTRDKEESIVGMGMLVLLGLIALITIADVMKLF